MQVCIKALSKSVSGAQQLVQHDATVAMPRSWSDSQGAHKPINKTLLKCKVAKDKTI